MDERGLRYLSDRFDWAAPGDQQQDAWLVRFCDQDCGDAIFTGPDAEREAWEYWNRYAPGFNIYVFRLAALKPEAGDGRVAALEAFARKYVEVWNAGTGTVYLLKHALAALDDPVDDTAAIRDLPLTSPPAGYVMASSALLGKAATAERLACEATCRYEAEQLRAYAKGIREVFAAPQAEQTGEG